MWLWRPDVRRKITIWGYLCVLSLLVHAIGIMLLMFVYRGYCVECISVGKNFDTKVVMYACPKLVPGAQKGALPLGSETRINTSITRTSGRIKDVPVRSQPSKKNTTLTSQSISLNKEKAAKKTSAGKSKDKKQRLTKVPVVKRRDVREEIPHQVTQEPKMTGQPLALQQESVPSNAIVSEPLPEATQLYNVHQRELDILAMHHEIQYEIEQHWQPPAGFAGAQCYIRVTIDWQGKLATTDIERGSGIPLYDISARRALRLIHFPRSAYGKEIVIHFSA